MGLSEAARQAGWASSQGLAGDPVSVKAVSSQARPSTQGMRPLSGGSRTDSR